MSKSLHIGLLSGTSVDAIDCALCQIDEAGSVQLLHTLAYPIPKQLRADIEALSHPGDNEIARQGILDRQLGKHFADAVGSLLTTHGVAASNIAAIGSHGQTIRHHPPSSGMASTNSFSLQIGDPNTIAELTGITTVADFRRRDIAAGGEGAPLAPLFHAAVFGRTGTRRAVVNIGGFANISVLNGHELVTGFDSGPGNNLMDYWVRKHQNTPYDEGGRWAASGTIDHTLLQAMLSDGYFDQDGPRSTGKEHFNAAWLDMHLAAKPSLKPEDVQATLAELSAVSIANALQQSTSAVDEVGICGGGAYNDFLLQRLSGHLPDSAIVTTEAWGIAPDWVEASLFAWLSWRTLNRIASDTSLVTGAAGPRILGAIYQA